MYSSKMTAKEEPPKAVKPNLKIVIGNENMETSSSSSSLDENNNSNSNGSNKNEQVSEISDEEDAIEVDVDNNEIEFHVNLDKVPPTLQNTILNEKIYLNESIKESNPPENINEISSDDLKLIYESLGLTEASFASDEESANSIKLNLYYKNKLHLYGTDELNTNDIFAYFKDYKPIAVEWVNDSSCNVIWKNEAHVANALLGMSVSYENVESESKLTSDSDASKSKVISLKNRKFQMQPPKDTKWRKGVTSAKGYDIYMRYMRHTDHKQKGAESRSEYYRKYGNPNYGNLKGIISQSKRERMKNQQLDSANSDLTFDEKPVNSRRSLISYELDDYSQNNIEEFGTNKSFSDKKNDDDEEAFVNVKIKSREKKLRLYSDDLVSRKDESEESSENENDSKMRSDKIGEKRKNRFEPYESSKLRRSTKAYEEDDDYHDSSRTKREFDRLRDRYRFNKDPSDLRNKLNSLRN